MTRLILASVMSLLVGCATPFYDVDLLVDGLIAGPGMDLERLSVIVEKDATMKIQHRGKHNFSIEVEKMGEPKDAWSQLSGKSYVPLVRCEISGQVRDFALISANIPFPGEEGVEYYFALFKPSLDGVYQFGGSFIKGPLDSDPCHLIHDPRKTHQGQWHSRP